MVAPLLAIGPLLMWFWPSVEPRRSPRPARCQPGTKRLRLTYRQSSNPPRRLHVTAEATVGNAQRTAKATNSDLRRMRDAGCRTQGLVLHPSRPARDAAQSRTQVLPLVLISFLRPASVSHRLANRCRG